MVVHHKRETNYAKGVAAEDLALKYLQKGGYEVLHTRYKTKFGEIDLIAQKNNVICFIEVKIRQSIEEALYAVTPKSRKRIEQSALFFISQNPEYQKCDMRFDVIAITEPFHILHLDNAWESSS